MSKGTKQIRIGRLVESLNIIGIKMFLAKQLVNEIEDMGGADLIEIKARREGIVEGMQQVIDVINMAFPELKEISAE